ncbi:MAG: hypothetical protein Q9195_009256 [Heterodermia aff. obscurata]
MPGFMGTMIQRVSDARDEWNERMEDGMTGRRNKYGLKTNLWYEEEERRQRREERHRRRRHHRDRSRGHSSLASAEEGDGEDYMMSGADGDPVEGHESGLPEFSEVGSVAAQEDRHSRRSSRSHRSQALSQVEHPSSRHSGSRRSTRSGIDPERQSRQRRTRGEEESPIVEILERTDVPYGRELPPQEDGAPQVYGPPPIYDSQHMYAPPGVYGPRPRKGTKDPSRRHPKMRSYDDGGLMSLVKAIGINLVEEQMRRKNEAENRHGRNDERPKQRKPRGRDEERRGRSRRPRSVLSPSPRSYRRERLGSELPETPRPGTPAGVDGHHEPPMDPAIAAEYRQAEEMEEERAQEAREMEEGHAASSHHPEEHNPAHQENPFHDGHEAAPPMDSSISSMPPSITSSTHRHSAAASSAPRGRPEIPEQTDSEGSDGVHSGNESDRSDTSTRATVPSSNPSSLPQSSRSPGSAIPGGRSGRRGGRGGRTQATRPRGGGGFDHLDDEYYDLLESYDNEYEALRRGGRESTGRPVFGPPKVSSGRRNPGLPQRQTQLVKLPDSDFWVAVEHYEYYLINPPPRAHAPGPSTQQNTRHKHHKSGGQGTDDDPNAASKGKKNSSKKPENENQKKSRPRHEEYEADAEGRSRTTRSPKPKAKAKSTPKAKPRRHDHIDESSSDSDPDPSPKRPQIPPPRQRSPRPYTRTGTRTTAKPKKRTRDSDSDSSDSSTSSDSDGPYSREARHHSPIPPPPKDYYAILGLKPTATAAE